MYEMTINCVTIDRRYIVQVCIGISWKYCGNIMAADCVNVCIATQFTHVELTFGTLCMFSSSSALTDYYYGRRPGDKPLPEPTMVSLLTHLCVTRPQWVNLWCRGARLNQAMICIYIYILVCWTKMIKHHFQYIYIYAYTKIIDTV